VKYFNEVLIENSALCRSILEYRVLELKLEEIREDVDEFADDDEDPNGCLQRGNNE